MTNSSRSPHDMENDSIVLLTFGHIRSEKFLVQPIKSFKLLKSDEIFVIPDKDKALITAVQETLTNARHVFCAKHVQSHLVEKPSGTKYELQQSCVGVWLVSPNFWSHKLLLVLLKKSGFDSFSPQ